MRIRIPVNKQGISFQLWASWGDWPNTVITLWWRMFWFPHPSLRVYFWRGRRIR